MTTETNDLSLLTYEQGLAELESIVAALESNQLPLQEAMTLFARGQALVQHCIGLLDNAELKVRQVTGEILEGPAAED
jgi:exodeoxyribonuclease VII small subunit